MNDHEDVKRSILSKTNNIFILTIPFRNTFIFTIYF